jgi:hypothetical protein
MILKNVLHYCCLKMLPAASFLLTIQPANNDDPGLPGGDPDLPDAPLDSGVFLLVALVLIYGIYKSRSQTRMLNKNKPGAED